MKILFLIPHIFIPENSGNKQLIANLLRHVTKYVDCDLCIMVDKLDDRSVELSKINSSLPQVKKVFFFNQPSGFYRKVYRLKALLSGYPMSIGNYQSNKLSKWLLNSNIKQYDVVHLDMLYMAQYHKHCHEIPSLLVPSDAYSLSAKLVRKAVKSYTEKIRMMVYYLLIYRYEKNTYRKIDIICSVAEKDTRYLSKFINGPKFKTVGVAVGEDILQLSLQRLKSDSCKPCNLLYIGPVSQEGAAAGLEFFIKKSFFNICESFPNIRLYIVGHTPVPSLKKLIDTNEKIIHIDFVDDYFGFFNNDWVYVHPQRTNAGFQTKVQQAMAIALPVVGYNLAFTGMAIENHVHCYVCDSMNEFTDSIISLIGEPILREKIGFMARELMQNQYSVESIGSEYIKCYKLLEQTNKYEKYTYK